MKWAYKVIRIEIEKIEEELDKLGKREWELVSTVVLGREQFIGPQAKVVILILKRPKTE